MGCGALAESPVFPDNAPWQVFVLQALHGTSFAIISNVGIMFFQDLVPGQAGLATTIYTNATNLGNLVGFFTFGLFVQPLGHRGLFGAAGYVEGDHRALGHLRVGGRVGAGDEADGDGG